MNIFKHQKKVLSQAYEVGMSTFNFKKLLYNKLKGVCSSLYFKTVINKVFFQFCNYISLIIIIHFYIYLNMKEYMK